MLNFRLASLFAFAFILSFATGVATAQVAPTPSPAAIAKSREQQPVRPADPAALTAAIRTILDRPEYKRAIVAVKIASLADGRTIFEQNAGKYVMPASNMKNFTVAAALETLTPDFRFKTGIFAATPPDSAGTISGDLRIFGRGDVSISAGFLGAADPFAAIDRIADKIIALGVKRIEGDIVGDDSYFRGYRLPDTWEWDDLQWYYGAEISSLPVNDNVIDVIIRPGPVGYPCTVKLTPFNPVMRVANGCITLPAGARPTVSLQRRLDENYLEIGGGIASGAKDFSTRISVARPAELFAALLRQRLIDKGVEVIGGYRYEKRPDGSPPAGTQIAEIESVPLAEIAAKTMKPSQNMYTEVLLRTLGENQRDAIIRSAPDSPEAKKTSAELGLVAVSRFLERIGLPPDAIVQYDGSGLSRHNLITAEAVVRLYEYMSRESRFAKQWRESLTVGGVDGTLRNRYIGTSAAGNVRGKTGTIDQVSALSGYLKTAGGEEVVFSLIVNQMPSAQMRTGLIDEMVVLLADYKGRLTADGTTPNRPAK